MAVRNSLIKVSSFGKPIKAIQYLENHKSALDGQHPNSLLSPFPLLRWTGTIRIRIAGAIRLEIQFDEFPNWRNGSFAPKEIAQAQCDKSFSYFIRVVFLRGRLKIECLPLKLLRILGRHNLTRTTRTTTRKMEDDTTRFRGAVNGVVLHTCCPKLAYGQISIDTESLL